MSNVNQSNFSSGNKNQNVNIGSIEGDNTQVNYNYSETIEEKEFTKFLVEPLDPSPQVTSQLIEIIKENHLLILAGSFEIEKLGVASHIGWHLRKVLQKDKDENSTGNNDDENYDEISVLLWRLSSDLKHKDDPVVKLRKIEDVSILISHQVRPEQVGHKLSRVQKAAQSKHYIIFTTNVSLEGWALSEEPSKKPLYWQELSPDTHYTSDQLIKVLQRKIGEAQRNAIEKELPSQVVYEEFFETYCHCSKSLEDLVQKLKLPDYIDRFVNLLGKEKSPLSPYRIDRLISLAQAQESSLLEWFYGELDSRERMFALALSLFEGVFDDQFFAAIEMLVDEAWRRHDPFLKAFDYADLNKVRDFFPCAKISPHLVQVEKRIENQRQNLFKAVWNTHRRQILVTLPVIINLVKASVNNRAFDFELYSSREKRDLLRRSIAKTLGDMGLIHHSAVELTLLKLAADEDWGVQAVAARAMARWYEYGSRRELFGTLNSWWSATGILYLTRLIRGEQNEKRNSSYIDYIRATVALTMGYAAQHDPSDNLSEELCDLFKDLSKDDTPLVRNRFQNHTIPSVVTRHLIQLRKLLQDMVQDVGLIEAIGNGLTRAYYWRPEDVLQTLQLWHEECRLSDIKEDNQPVTHRQKLLATVVFAYGDIDWDIYGPLSVKEVFQRLCTILKEEYASFVREYTIQAVRKQAHLYFEEIEPQLHKLMSSLPEKERQKIVPILTEIHLEQFKQIDDKKSEQFGYNLTSLTTPVEKAMLRWIKDATNQAAQQVAVHVSIAIADLGTKQEKEIANTPPKSFETNRSFWHKWIIWLATINIKNYYQVIYGLFPSIFKYYITERASINSVFNRWQIVADEEVKMIVECLRRALYLATNIRILLIAGVMGVFIILYPISLMFSSIIEG